MSQQEQQGGEIPEELLHAIKREHLGFFAGAGVSVPSGLGGWNDQYLPLLEQMEAGWMADLHLDLPTLLQLLCADATRSSRLFDLFKQSFGRHAQPNGYHFAMLRSLVPRVWTSNYDRLFESAIATSGLDDFRTAVDDKKLLEHFRDSNLVIKVNGDFESASYSDDLNWGMVLIQDQFDRADLDRREIWRLFEDDFRNRSMVFVGVSFQDPILRRILSVAASRVRRPRHRHFLLARTLEAGPEADLQTYAAKNLLRYHIETVEFAEFTAIQRFVSQLAIRARRPIIGVSGSTETSDDGSGDDLTLPGGSINGGALRALSREVGRTLASAGYRVTSGGAPYVGREVVDAAFEVDETLARYYFRRQGGTQYTRNAPAIIVNTNEYTGMRTRFIGEISALLAIGGTGEASESGVTEEIEMAQQRGAPVLLFPQAGGVVAELHQKFMQEIPTRYGSARLSTAIRTANERLAQLSPDELMTFVGSDLGLLLEDVLCALLESDSDADAARNHFPAW